MTSKEAEKSTMGTEVARSKRVGIPFGRKVTLVWRGRRGERRLVLSFIDICCKIGVLKAFVWGVGKVSPQSRQVVI